MMETTGGGGGGGASGGAAGSHCESTGSSVWAEVGVVSTTDRRQHVLRFPDDPCMDSAMAEALVKVMRRDPRVDIAAHGDDYDGVFMTIRMRDTVTAVSSVLGDAAHAVLCTVEQVTEQLRVALQTAIPPECI